MGSRNRRENEKIRKPEDCASQRSSSLYWAMPWNCLLSEGIVAQKLNKSEGVTMRSLQQKAE
jgi:hypothetical protein